MATPRICAVEGCDKKHFGRGFCRTHYARWAKHGDPHKGVSKRGEPERYYREIVLNYDGDDCLIWPFGKSSGGYGRIHLEGKDHNVSRLVCEETNGPPPSPRYEAAHSCGNGHLGCVTKRHLSWKTPAENQMDRVAHGTSNRGERQGRSKLTESDVLAIRTSDKGPYELARIYGVNHSNIIAIRKRKSWAWLE